MTPQQTPPSFVKLGLLYRLDDDTTETEFTAGYFNNAFYVDGNKPFKYEVIAWFEPTTPNADQFL